MNIDPLTAAQLQILATGLILALVGWYFIHQEKKKAHPDKETPVSDSSPADKLAEAFGKAREQAKKLL